MATPTNNYYLNARREWNERYGDHIAQARNWRMVAITASIAAVIAAAVAGGIFLDKAIRQWQETGRAEKQADAANNSLITSYETVSEKLAHATKGTDEYNRLLAEQRNLQAMMSTKQTAEAKLHDDQVNHANAIQLDFDQTIVKHNANMTQCRPRYAT